MLPREGDTGKEIGKVLIRNLFTKEKLGLIMRDNSKGGVLWIEKEVGGPLRGRVQVKVGGRKRTNRGK